MFIQIVGNESGATTGDTDEEVLYINADRINSIMARRDRTGITEMLVRVGDMTATVTDRETIETLCRLLPERTAAPIQDSPSQESAPARQVGAGTVSKIPPKEKGIALDETFVDPWG